MNDLFPSILSMSLKLFLKYSYSNYIYNIAFKKVIWDLCESIRLEDRTLSYLFIS